MSAANLLKCGVLALAVAAGTASASATTLIHAGLDDLVAANRAVVVGEVMETRSYWNEGHTFILTDVRLALDDVIKGDARQELEITILGGRVGDRTKLIVGGPELIPGRSYVLFLNEESLPGIRSALTVRDLSQGVFEVRIGRGGLRAVSQANGHPLLPDASGYSEAPGGAEGLPFVEMMQSLRQTAERNRREVQ